MNNRYTNYKRQKILNIRSSIIYRCTNQNNKSYKIYGGRGIKICNEWKEDKESFYNWAISNGYKEGLQLDRINTNGDYEPSNCRWVTSKQNNNNRRNNHKYEMNGEVHTLSEWCDIYNVDFESVRQRINKLKWDLKKALTTENKRPIKYGTLNGITKPLYQWADEYGIKRKTFFQRIKYGYPLEEAIKNENFINNGNRTRRKISKYGKY